MKIYDVIKRPIITEKSVALQAAGAYAFVIDGRATKHDIREAVEALFKVQVTKVRTMTVPGKQRRVGRFVGKTAPWKKTIVTLKEGDRIEFVDTHALRAS